MKGAPIALGGVALLAGCGDGHCPRIAEPLRYCLQAPALAPAGHSLWATTVDTPAGGATLLLRVRSDARQTTLIGLSPLGQTLFSLRWDGARVDAAGSLPAGLDNGFSPAAWLGLLQLALLPMATSAAGLPPGLRWVAADNGAWTIQDAAGQSLLARYEATPATALRIALPATATTVELNPLTE